MLILKTARAKGSTRFLLLLLTLPVYAFSSPPSYSLCRRLFFSPSYSLRLKVFLFPLLPLSVYTFLLHPSPLLPIPHTFMLTPSSLSRLCSSLLLNSYSLRFDTYYRPKIFRQKLATSTLQVAISTLFVSSHITSSLTDQTPHAPVFCAAPTSSQHPSIISLTQRYPIPSSLLLSIDALAIILRHHDNQLQGGLSTLEFSPSEAEREGA